MSSQKSGRQWISRITATWLSVLSWMRWRQRRRLRLQQEREQLLDQIASRVRTELLDAMTHLSYALERQDRLAEHLTQRLQEDLATTASQQTELLLEVLSSLQPPVESQLLPRVQAPSRPPSFSHSWVS